MIEFKKERVQHAVLIGVLIKELKGRPDVFQAYKQDASAVGSLPEQATTTTGPLTSADDTLWLEDSTLRIKLDVDVGRIASLCSGLVVGVRGLANFRDEFKVTAICFPQTLLAQPIPAPREQNPQYLALLSDINVGGAESCPKLREALLEFLTKQSMQESDRRLAACIQRVLICGGLFAGGDGAAWRPSRAALDEADRFLFQLSSGLPVDLMPGEHDPTNLSLPQKPFLPHLFSAARSQSHLRFVGNPFEADLDGFLVLGHAGQPVRDILRCTNNGNPLSALLMSFESLHLAPTAPETLAVPPLTISDPFIIQSAPHVLFSGGHESLRFEWRACAKTGSGTLCLCVPSFSATATITLVNLCNPRNVQIHKFEMKN
jgi:DNA polymerase delta subunit 2